MVAARGGLTARLRKKRARLGARITKWRKCAAELARNTAELARTKAIIAEYESRIEELKEEMGRRRVARVVELLRRRHS